ncbi:hypothetical protein JB92DRAFT_2928191 [Gautieria morchelliformis]|nr:hypothetical protein JB92DRAFT_2928191 [Gautieria morchelliformis]
MMFGSCGLGFLEYINMCNNRISSCPWDAYHLPPGMTRVGYDERTERYTFRQGDELWLGESGSLYGGKMKWAGKAPDASPPSDEDYDTDSSGVSKDGKVSKKVATGIHNGGFTTLPYLQESKNEWGVPVASISDTGAKPPDTSLGRRGTQLKKVAQSTVTALGVTRRWSRKKVPSRDGDVDGEKQSGQRSDKKEFSLEDDSFAEKALPVRPED